MMYTNGQAYDAQRALSAVADGIGATGHHRGPVPGVFARLLWEVVWRED